jgi:hypothetical protein
LVTGDYSFTRAVNRFELSECLSLSAFETLSPNSRIASRPPSPPSPAALTFLSIHHGSLAIFRALSREFKAPAETRVTCKSRIPSKPHIPSLTTPSTHTHSRLCTVTSPREARPCTESSHKTQASTQTHPHTIAPILKKPLHQHVFLRKPPACRYQETSLKCKRKEERITTTKKIKGQKSVT